MEATGTSRPKFFGSSQGTRLGPEKSRDIRSCNSSGLGRKKSQDASEGCFRNSWKKGRIKGKVRKRSRKKRKGKENKEEVRKKSGSGMGEGKGVGTAQWASEC